MCLSSPKAPPPPPERVAMKSPQDATGASPFKRRRQGFWASVLTGPQGIAGAPMTTGSTGSVTGG